jgi:hypothetical protein
VTHTAAAGMAIHNAGVIARGGRLFGRDDMSRSES